MHDHSIVAERKVKCPTMCRFVPLLQFSNKRVNDHHALFFFYFFSSAGESIADDSAAAGRDSEGPICCNTPDKGLTLLNWRPCKMIVAARTFAVLFGGNPWPSCTLGQGRANAQCCPAPVTIRKKGEDKMKAR